MTEWQFMKSLVRLTELRGDGWRVEKMMKLQPPGDAPCLGRWERLLYRHLAMCVQIVQGYSNHLQTVERGCGGAIANNVHDVVQNNRIKFGTLNDSMQSFPRFGVTLLFGFSRWNLGTPPGFLRIK